MELTDKDNPPEPREGFVWVWDDRAGQWVERGLPPLLKPRTAAQDNEQAISSTNDEH